MVSKEYQPPTGLRKCISLGMNMPVENCGPYRIFALVLNRALMASQKPPRVDGEAVAQSIFLRVRLFEMLIHTGHALRLLLTSDPLHCPIF